MPCGTSHVISLCFEELPLILTYCFLLSWYDLNHYNDSPLIPQCSSFLRSISWFSVSKALAKFRKIEHAFSRFSIAFIMYTYKFNPACSVDFSFREGELFFSQQSLDTSYQLLVPSHQLLVTSYQSLVTSYQLLITSYHYQPLVCQSLVASYQSLVTSYSSMKFMRYENLFPKHLLVNAFAMI